MSFTIGEKLKKLRKAKGLSLTEVSALTGCSVSYLSMVENAKVDPSISRLKKISDGLGVTVVDLFQSQTGERVVLHKDERIHGHFSRSKTHMEILIPSTPDEKQLDARLAVIHPEGGSEGDYSHPGEEFGLVLKGRFELVVDGLSYLLSEGDSFYFKSVRRHSFKNAGEGDAIVLWVNHPPTW